MVLLQNPYHKTRISVTAINLSSLALGTFQWHICPLVPKIHSHDGIRLQQTTVHGIFFLNYFLKYFFFFSGSVTVVPKPNP